MSPFKVKIPSDPPPFDHDELLMEITAIDL